MYTSFWCTVHSGGSKVQMAFICLVQLPAEERTCGCQSDAITAVKSKKFETVHRLGFQIQQENTKAMDTETDTTLCFFAA